MSIDLPSLAATYALIVTVNALALIVAAYLWREIPGPRWWAAGAIVTAGYAIFLPLTSEGTLRATSIVGVLVSLFVMFSIHRGLLVFNEAQLGRRTVPNLTAITSVVLVAMELGGVPSPVRNLTYLLVMSVLTGITATTAWQGSRRPESRLPAKLVAISIMLLLAVIVFRVISGGVTIVHGLQLSEEVRDVATVLVLCCLTTLRTFSLALLVISRLQAEIKSHTEAMRALSERDPLTSLVNRRLLHRVGAATHASWLRYRRRYSVILADIDHFKQLNDDFGHPFGDTVLRDVGAILAQRIRQTDTCGRYGGEEFLIILPETVGEAAAHLAERLRAALGELAGKHANGPKKISASFGVAAVGIDDTEFDAVLKRADGALYHAKASGRDRVHLAELTDA